MIVENLSYHNPCRQATEDLYQALDERRQLLLALADRSALLAHGDEPRQQLGRLTAAAAALESQVPPLSLATWGAAPEAFAADSTTALSSIQPYMLHRACCPEMLLRSSS